MRTLILGGARSGKSSYAEEQVGAGPCVYVATARPWAAEDGFDEDFTARIRHHVERRPDQWTTEDRRDVVEVLEALATHEGALTVLVDDLGTWVTHLIDRADGWEGPRGAHDETYRRLVSAIGALPDNIALLVVSPEVGMGIIPEHRSGRLFRDEIGALNQMVAAACERVELVIAGQALSLKS